MQNQRFQEVKWDFRRKKTYKRCNRLRTVWADAADERAECCRLLPARCPELVDELVWNEEWNYLMPDYMQSWNKLLKGVIFEASTWRAWMGKRIWSTFVVRPASTRQLRSSDRIWGRADRRYGNEKAIFNDGISIFYLTLWRSFQSFGLKNIEILTH